MEWVWPLYQEHVDGTLARAGNAAPSDADRQTAFIEALGESSVTVLVQEPWQGHAVRFKTLARYDAATMMPLLNDPEAFLLAHFGGGKFKLNFHRGWHFVATRNFKPEGTPRWKDLPDLG